MHTTNPSYVSADQPLSQVIPRLEQGDRLTRPEFERRYTSMPNLKKAELIEGVVYMPSPAGHPHASSHGRAILWLGNYSTGTPGVDFSADPTVRLDLDNEPQPDALLRIETSFGGRSRVAQDQFLELAPELVFEVASSSVSYDLHAKFNVYRRNGVMEYIVWRVLEEDLDWFILREGNYERLIPTEEVIFKSQVFPGLWLNKPALLRDDMPTVLATLNQGLASPEHDEFVARLRAAHEAKK